jgi:hypothetical protein
MMLASGEARAGILFSDDFNGYSGGTGTGGQYQTGLPVYHSGNLPGWNKSGGGVVHAVDRGAGNIAALIWQDNVITLAAGLSANAAGTVYTVSFAGGPAVYQNSGQVTSATDGMVIDVLREDGSVLSTLTYRPGAWAGTQSFATASFSYTGDGSGPVKLRIGPLAASGRFAGAIDALTLSDPTPPPLPVIVTPPSASTVEAGDNLTLAVSATGATSYQWRKDGKDIGGATAATFRIIDATPADAGSYSVAALNETGAVTSQPAVVTVKAAPSYQTVIFSESFNGYTGGNQNATQFQTGLKVYHSGNLPGWNKSGAGTVHAVNRNGSTNFADMIWQDNVITLSAGLAANESGVTYFVDFNAGAATYNTGAQTTSENEHMVVDVLRADDGVLESFTCPAVPWTGVATFARYGFQYTGDGSGPVRLRVRPEAATGRFAGAIDNLRLATNYVPVVPPVFTLQPSGATLAAGDDLVLTAEASGLPAFQWRKNGAAIAGATTATLSLSDVKPSDAGTYTVAATNGAGTTLSSAAVISVTPAPGYPDYLTAVLTDNPIHYYPLDEISGSTALDLGSLATTGGICNGGITLGQPSFSTTLGRSAYFDGQPGTFVDLGQFHPGDSVTVEAWVNLAADASHTPSYHDIVGRMDGSYIIDFAPDDRIEFAAFNDSGTLAKSGGGINAGRNRWHHVVGVFSNGTATVYVNGIKGTTQTIGGTLQNLGPDPDRVLIGASRNGSVSSFNFRGFIDEVAIYDSALSPARIRAHYRTGVPALSLQDAVHQGDSFRFTVPGYAGFDYRAEYSDDLKSWQPLTDWIPGTGAPLLFTDPASPGRGSRFYRPLRR